MRRADTTAKATLLIKLRSTMLFRALEIEIVLLDIIIISILFRTDHKIFGSSLLPCVSRFLACTGISVVP